jgi:peptidoglycan/xylan/chitin deacetylase (PgdA/CDA1 family)
MMNCPGRMAFLPVLAAASAALVLLGIAGPGTPARAATTHTIVSLTFDDSDEDQYTNALPALESHGMHGTF